MSRENQVQSFVLYLDSYLHEKINSVDFQVKLLHLVVSDRFLYLDINYKNVQD